MAQYDGSIRINTHIDSKNASVQLRTLENRMEKTADKIAGLRSKLESLKTVQIPTDEFKAVQAQIDATEKKINNLVARQEKFLTTGGKESSAAYKRMQYDIDELQNSLPYLKSELQDLIDSGEAFIFGNPEEIAKAEKELQYAEKDMSVLNQKHDELVAKQRKAVNGYKKLGDTAKKSLSKIDKSTKKTGGLLGTLGSRFKSLALSLLIFNQISKAARAMSNAVKEGFSNLYNDSNMTAFKNQVDGLKASLLTLKNAFAAAFRPLVEIAIPYIQKAIEYLTLFIDKIGQFMAAITGQKTYTKAIKQTTAALKDQNKAQNRQLSSLDKLNNTTSDSGGGSAGDSGASTMFEEVPIDSGILDFLQKIQDFLKPVIGYAQKLKDIFAQGFFDGLGDWEYRFESIKGSIASIKESLKDIFTDSAVLSSADSWVQSLTYMLGSLVGATASIGLTIATNILGGIAKYLEQNKESIKEYFISMFNIWEEVNYMFSDLFQSIAYVFEAFSSEQGQQLTANIIGIFTNAFMDITELASEIFRDISQIIIQPFVDNKESFRTALEGFLSVLAEVTGTIKQGIDDTFDKLNEVYDTHFKPFFDSVANGLSDTVGKFMEFWNGSVQPILDDWAEKFDVLWKEHIQPMIDNFIELLGSVADLLKELWENILKPLIDWIIKNVLPLILPILDTIYNTIVKVIGGISDIISNFIKILKGCIDLIVALIKGDWDSVWKASKEIVKNTFDAIFSTIKTVLDLVIGIIKTILQTAIAVFRTNFNLIKDIVEKVWGKIKELTSSLKEWLSTHIEDMLTGLKETWDSIWDSFFNKVSEVWESIKSVISGAIDGIKGWIGDLTSAFGKLGSAKGNAGSSSGFSGSTTSPSGISTYSAMPQMGALSKMEFPGYATGQVIPTSMKKHLAWLGDNPRETEVVSPLSTIEEAVENAMLRVGGIGGGKITLEVPIYLNNREIARGIQEYDMQMFNKRGKGLFEH